MRKLIFSCILIFSVFSSAFAQIDTLSIYHEAKKVIGPATKSASLLGVKVAYGYDDDASKVIAISSWIGDNIAYDYEGYIKHRSEKYDSYEVLKKKKALCGEYAQLFKEMCESVGIDVVIVGGYTRGMDFMPNDTLYRSEHAWNAVLIDKKWELVDVTFAAGKIVQKKQNFKKGLNSLFGMHTKPKYKFEKRFRPEWILKHPRQMILTHLPEVEMFQLLEAPIPVIAFSKGQGITNEYIKSMPQLKQNSKALMQYLEKDPVHKCIYTGDKGLEFNKFNNRLKGAMYLQALDTMYERYYDINKKMLVADKQDIILMKRYSVVADSLLKAAMDDNNLELAQKQKQSEVWKEQIKTNNKVHITAIKERIKKNKNNAKTIKKLRFRNMSMSEFILSRYYQYKLMPDLSGVRRPKITDSTSIKNSGILMHQQDSIGQVVCLKQSVDMDLLHEEYYPTKIAEIVHKDLVCLSIMEANNKKYDFLKEYTPEYFPLVYSNNQLTEKTWMTFNNHLADSIKMVNSDTMLIALEANQAQFNTLLKDYTKSTKEQLQLIKMAKKGSTEDMGEDSTYVNIQNRYKGDMLDFQSYLNTYTASRRQLLTYLKKQNKEMNKSISTLRDENDFENFRHKAYMDYRKEIRVSENNKIKEALKNLNRQVSTIDRSLQQAK